MKKTKPIKKSGHQPGYMKEYLKKKRSEPNYKAPKRAKRAKKICAGCHQSIVATTWNLLRHARNTESCKWHNDEENARFLTESEVKNLNVSELKKPFNNRGWAKRHEK